MITYVSDLERRLILSSTLNRGSEHHPLRPPAEGHGAPFPSLSQLAKPCSSLWLPEHFSPLRLHSRFLAAPSSSLACFCAELLGAFRPCDPMSVWGACSTAGTRFVEPDLWVRSKKSHLPSQPIPTGWRAPVPKLPRRLCPSALTARWDESWLSSGEVVGEEAHWLHSAHSHLVSSSSRSSIHVPGTSLFSSAPRVANTGLTGLKMLTSDRWACTSPTLCRTMWGQHSPSSPSIMGVFIVWHQVYLYL